MRCFIGLDICAQQKMAIGSWRNRALPPLPKAVPAANFHITLAFLGQVEAHQLEPLCEQLQNIEHAPFSCEINQTGYFSKAKVFWIGPNQCPTELAQLANQVQRAAKGTGLQLKNQPYQPHITLARKMLDNPPAPLIAPQFDLHFNQFHLFESVSTNAGVNYCIRNSWQLT